MKKSVKKRFAIALTLMLIGGLQFCTAMTLNGWDFSALSGMKIEKSTVEISEGFQSIRIDTKQADVSFFMSNDVICRVELAEEEKMKHRVTVEDGILSIEQTDMREWYDYIDIGLFHNASVRVYLPETEYDALSVTGTTGDVNIPTGFTFADTELRSTTGDISFDAHSSGKLCLQTTTGDIRIFGAAAAEMDLNATTGDIELKSVACEGTLQLSLTTGDIDLQNVACAALDCVGTTGSARLTKVIAEEKISAELSTGDIRLEDCDAGELTLKTDTGDITGSLLTEKIFIARSDTGRIRVPETMTGGMCKATTDTGDIELEVCSRKP